MAKPVFALVGNDTFLQLEAIREILAEMTKDVQRVDVDGERAELADVLDELRSFAMFGGAKLVVVREADSFVSRFRQQLEAYIAAPSDTGTLVLRLNSLPKIQKIYKAVSKVGKIVDCEPPKDPVRWIVDQGKSVHKITLAPDAARLLAELVGNDLGRLDSELAKLAIQSDSGKIDSHNITQAVAFQREQEIKDMTSELASGNATAALRRWRQLVQLDSSAEFRAVTWLGMWLEDVGVVVSGGSTGNLGWKYGNRLLQFIQSAKSLGKAGHARALDLLAEIDHQSKSGVGDAASNVERFILQMASKS
jgi:DNA polymerase-3 subunit delta